MDRRRYTTGVGAFTVTALAGCLRGDGGDSPVVEGSDLTLAAGEQASVTASAENVDRLSFGVSFVDSEEITAESFDVDPSPDTTGESFPPVWMWNETRSSVEATMTVQAADDASPGTVSYSVTGTLGEESVTEEFEIEIQSSSG